MLVQVFEYDKPLPVYGIIVYNYTRHLILHDPEGKYFFLQPEQFPRNLQIKMYQQGFRLPDTRAVHFVQLDCHGWLTADGAVCDVLSDFCTGTHAPTTPWIAGYPEIISHVSLLRRLMNGESVPDDQTGIPLRQIHLEEAWYEITTQAEADLFLQGVMGFHDGHIDRVIYRESEYEPYTVTVTFDLREWNGCRIEYCFTEPIVTHITNGRDDNARSILNACLYIDEAGVFWADQAIPRDDVDRGSLPAEVTYIRAASVKVRRVD